MSISSEDYKNSPKVQYLMLNPAELKRKIINIRSKLTQSVMNNSTPDPLEGKASGK